MKKILHSTLILLILLAVICVIFIRLFSVSVFTVSVLAAFLAVYGSLMALLLKNAKKAQKLMDDPSAYAGTKGTIFRIALCISALFYFLLFALALFPIRHYAVWFLFFVPAMIMFVSQLGAVADFCRAFGISKKLFWTIQLLIQLTAILCGRACSVMLFKNFT